MKKFTFAFFAVVASLFTSCDKIFDNVDFNDLLGTWGITSYHIEGRPSPMPVDTRISFYGDYTFVTVANNEKGNGEIGDFAFNDQTNDLTFAGNTCKVKTLNESTLKISYINSSNQRCEMLYSRVYPPSQNQIEMELSGVWEQHFDDGDFWNPNAESGDFYIYMFPNGDFIDMGSYMDGGNYTEYSRFGHYTISGRVINVYFGNIKKEIRIHSYTNHSLTLEFENGNATYNK